MILLLGVDLDGDLSVDLCVYVNVCADGDVALAALENLAHWPQHQQHPRFSELASWDAKS